MIEKIFVYGFLASALVVCIVSLYYSFLRLPRKMDSAYQSALRTLAAAVETKDSQTLGHGERVAEMVVRVVERLGLGAAEVKSARYAALMRDVGKASVPHRILNKAEKLTESEVRVVRNHVKEGAAIVAQVPFLAHLEKVVLHHHERWDGTGYPEGLAGEEIPLLSRVIGLVDDFEAMRSQRPYHPAIPEDQARQMIADGSGKLYDPRVVEAFLEVWVDVSDQPQQSAA